MESDTPAQSDSAPEASQPAVDGRNESTSPDTVDASNAADGSEAEPGTPDDQLPDASSLLAMAAMHMETTPLLQVLISVFHAHAWRSMGLVADHKGEVRKDMSSAQTAIDCFAFMLTKIEGALEDSEKRDVQRRLMDLRMNYVAKMREGQDG